MIEKLIRDGCVHIDTRYYWSLTDHIFRYNHHFTGNASIARARGIHTVNECRNTLVVVIMVLAEADVFLSYRGGCVHRDNQVLYDAHTQRRRIDDIVVI